MVIFTESDAWAAMGDGTGICRDCGAERDGCEPDAHNYECWDCGARAVVGFEMAVLEGLVSIEED